MALSDTVADFLTRIRNAKDARHKYVDVGMAKLNIAILDLLKEKRFILNYLVNEKKRQVRVFLKYKSRTHEPVIRGLKRMSTPGRRMYVKHDQIPRVLSGLGIAVVSTPSGILDGARAYKQKVGGELLCLVW